MDPPSLRSSRLRPEASARQVGAARADEGGFFDPCQMPIANSGGDMNWADGQRFRIRFSSMFEP